MALELKTIHVPTGGDADRLLREIDERVFVLQRNGVRYIVSRIDEAPNESTQPDESPEAPRLRVVQGDDIWAGYDPEKVRAALEKFIGSWSDVDTEEMKETLRRARDEGSKPPIVR
jgi:hypothetical protein